MIQFLLLAAVVLAGAAGDVSVARAMKGLGDARGFNPRRALRVFLRAIGSAFLWLGIFWKAVAFFCFIALISHADLSWVVPATAISFVVETLAAKYFLREHVSPLRWTGAACIFLGVLLISL